MNRLLRPLLLAATVAASLTTAMPAGALPCIEVVVHGPVIAVCPPVA